MTGNAANAKSEALELHELSSEELDAVSGGDFAEELAARIEQIRELAKASETAKELIRSA